MARPNKKGLDYFPFDVDFFSDEKIGAISGEFGIKGEIVVVKLLCAIYRKGYFILWDEVLMMKLLKDLPGISLELIEKIVNRLVKWGFFEQDLFSTARVLSSKEIQERYFEAIKRRKEMSEYPYLLINVCNNGVNVDNNSVNVYRSTQRKEKRKEKEREKEKPLPLPLSSDILEIPLRDCYNAIRSDQSWMEGLVMGKRYAGHRDFMPEDFHRYLKLFFHKLSSEGVTAKSPKDAKSHFSRWLDIELKNRKDGSTGNYSPGEELTADGKRKGVLYV